MAPHVCPWWGGYFIDNRLRRILHNPEKILAPHVRSGMTVMDFGCGMGLFSIAMARLVGPKGRIVAADLQQKMLDVLKRRAAKAGVADRIDAHCCKADSIGYAKPVDLALAFYSIHEVPHPGQAIAEILGLLKPEGRFLVVEPIGHVDSAEFRTLISLSQKAGFTIG